VIIGTPREIKDNEHRVALTPQGVQMLVEAGHEVLVESGAGEGSGFSDAEYAAAGGRLERDAATVWGAQLIVKVKEPLPLEHPLLRAGQILFTYLHLAADPVLTRQLVDRKVTAIAYETIEGRNGDLPLLTPMSEIAGRMAPQVGAHALFHMSGGRGTLLSGVPGVTPGRVVILGAGSVGASAARVAVGMGAQVTLFDRNLDRLRFLESALGGRASTLAANHSAIADAVLSADIVIGAVLVPGAKAPVLVTEEMVRSMQRGSVIVDVAVDQGGCVATIKPTSHSHPTYVRHGVVHYAVPNMPGAVPRTSTQALCNATLPYLLLLASQGLEHALAESPGLAAGVNTHDGAIINRAVAEAVGLACDPSH